MRVFVSFTNAIEHLPLRIVKVEVEWSSKEERLPRSVVLKIPSTRNAAEMSDKSEEMKEMMKEMVATWDAKVTMVISASDNHQQ